MSAFAVILNRDRKPVARELLEKITAPVVHLGPEGIRYLVKNHAGFAYLASHFTPESRYEKQPLLSEDERYILVADARIDNRPELLSELNKLLPNRSVITDADLILAGFRRWKHHCPIHFVGDFSFVIWDHMEQTLFAACDALGMRTLYYSEIEGDLYLASEALQITEHPKANNALSELALASWAFNHPDPNISLFQHIHLLSGGMQLEHNNRGLTCRRYWQPEPRHRIRYRQKREYAEQLHDILTRSVSDRMRTTKKVVATQLSGGMDSSSVTLLCKQLSSEQKKTHIAISQTYPGIPACDESIYIDEISSRHNVHSIRFDAEKIGAVNYPESHAPLSFSPFYVQDPVFSHTLSLVQEAGANVLLSGHGGDEMTQGSPMSYAERAVRGHLGVLCEIYRDARTWGISPAKHLFHILAAPLLPLSVLRFIYRATGRSLPGVETPPWITEDAIERLNLKKRYLETCGTPFTRRSQQEIFHILANSLIRPFLMGRSHIATPLGVDYRHPFLDRRVAEFVFAIPPELWRQNLFPKWLLRQTFKDSLPDNICWRKEKTVFNNRSTQALRDNKEAVIKLLSDRTLEGMGILKPSFLEGHVVEKLSDSNYTFGVNINRMLAIQTWIQRVGRN